MSSSCYPNNKLHDFKIHLFPIRYHKMKLASLISLKYTYHYKRLDIIFWSPQRIVVFWDLKFTFNCNLWQYNHLLGRWNIFFLFQLFTWMQISFQSCHFAFPLFIVILSTLRSYNNVLKLFWNFLIVMYHIFFTDIFIFMYSTHTFSDIFYFIEVC